MDLPVELTDALGILGEIETWQLSPARWQAIGPLLEALAAAVATGDTAAVVRASRDLALAGSTRIVRIGAATAPPPVVRERVNHLVHALRRRQDGQRAR